MRRNPEPHHDFARVALNITRKVLKGWGIEDSRSKVDLKFESKRITLVVSVSNVPDGRRLTLRKQILMAWSNRAKKRWGFTEDPEFSGIWWVYKALDSIGRPWSVRLDFPAPCS